MNDKYSCCLYFGGERTCPEILQKNRFECCLWRAERKACCSGINLEGFLSFVVDEVCQSGFADFVLPLARYVAQYPYCGETSKVLVAERFGLNEVMKFERPRGYTVFENLWQEQSRLGGFVLYRDGRVYELQGARHPRTSLAFVLLGKCRSLVAESRILLRANWTFLKGLPVRFGRYALMTRSEFLKFLSRRFKIFLQGCSREFQGLLSLKCKIIKLALKYGFWPDGNWCLKLEHFVEKWCRFMDEVVVEKSHRKWMGFLGPEFSKDCRRLGFEIAGTGTPRKDVEQESLEKRVVELKREENCFFLGNGIYALWNSLSRSFAAERPPFDPRLFKVLLLRLLDLECKDFCQLKPA